MFHLEKKPRLGSSAPAPPRITPTTLNHITGPATVHALFIRVALATNPKETLGMPDTAFTADDVWWFFQASWWVVYYKNKVNIAWIEDHKLCEVMDKAEDRLMWVKEVMWAELLADSSDEEM